MKKITVMNQTAKVTYEKGINDTDWTIKFFDGNGKALILDRWITTATLLETLKRCRTAGYKVTMATH